MSKKKKVLVLPFFSRSLAILHKNGKRVASQTSTPTKSLAVVNLVLLLLGLRRDCALLPSWCRICRKLFAKIFLESGCFPFAILPAKATRVTGPLQQQRHNHINWRKDKITKMSWPISQLVNYRGRVTPVILGVTRLISSFPLVQYGLLKNFTSSGLKYRPYRFGCIGFLPEWRRVLNIPEETCSKLTVGQKKTRN